MGSILYAEDSYLMREVISEELKERFPDVSKEVFSCGCDLEKRLNSGEPFAVALVDNTMPPGPQGIEIIENHRKKFPNSTFILYSASVELAEYAKKVGVMFMDKCADDSNLVFHEIRKALEKYNLQKTSIAAS